MIVGTGRRLHCSFYISPKTQNFRQIVGPGKDEKITIWILWYNVKVIIMLSELCILILWGREGLTWFSHHRIIIKSTFCSSDPAASIQHTLSNCKRVDSPPIQQNVLPGRVSCVPNYHKVGDRRHCGGGPLVPTHHHCCSSLLCYSWAPPRLSAQFFSGKWENNVKACVNNRRHRQSQLKSSLQNSNCISQHHEHWAGPTMNHNC